MRSSSPLLRLLRYARRYRGRILLASSCSILNRIFDLAPPLLIGAAVDVVVEREGSFLAGFGIADPVDQLWLLAGLSAVIWILESGFQYAYSIMWRNLAQTLQHDMRVGAYAHVQTLEMSYFEERSTGGLMSVLNDDVNQLERFLDHGATEMLHVGTTCVVIPTIFFILAPEVAWLAMLPVPVVLWGGFYFQRLLAPRYDVVREQVGLLNSQLSNNLGGIATIKSFTAEEHEVERIRKESDAYRKANRRAIALSSAFVPLIRMAILVGFLATVVYGGKLALEGSLRAGA
ncbi:MAG: ABC transporter ATP-binding protein, partial [Planctomycetota bacterium]|nr:ABC transporter ATP-binding protein [Planctomycetota bacterium]